MRIPSRKMPAPLRGGLVENVVGVGCLLTLAGALALPGLHWWPLTFVGPGLLVSVSICTYVQASRIRASRDGETICDFARQFDCRSIDTWIIRAVHEEFTSCSGYPVRATDSFSSMGLDPEDLDDLAEQIATRSGRDFKDTEDNPMFGSVDTLGDLVRFLNWQPPLRGFSKAEFA